MVICHNCAVIVTNGDDTHIQDEELLETIKNNLLYLGNIIVQDPVEITGCTCCICGEINDEVYNAEII